MRSYLALYLLPFYVTSAFTTRDRFVRSFAPKKNNVATPFLHISSPLKARSEDLDVAHPDESVESGLDNLQLQSPPLSSTRVLPALGTGLMTWMVAAQASVADSPDWGIFEGRTGSLLHPLTMGSLLLYSIYTALLGFQWRRQRTIGDEIKALQKSLPDLQGAGSVAAALQAAQSAEEPVQSRIATLQAALPIEQQIKELQQERKSLAEANPRDKHFSQGAWLAFLGTAFAIEVRIIQCCVHIKLEKLAE